MCAIYHPYVPFFFFHLQQNSADGEQTFNVRVWCQGAFLKGAEHAAQTSFKHYKHSESGMASLANSARKNPTFIHPADVQMSLGTDLSIPSYFMMFSPFQ